MINPVLLYEVRRMSILISGARWSFLKFFKTHKFKKKTRVSARVETSQTVANRCTVHTN